jgi:hypothetical protein
MAKQTAKAQLLKDIRRERRRLEQNLSGLSAQDMSRPGVTGEWSVKDILAHLVAWERLLLEWYGAGLRGESPNTSPVGMSRKAMDALNQHIFEQNRERGLDDVLAEFHASFQEVLAVAETMPEEELFARGRFDWTGRWTLADYVAGNTCNHYAWANGQVRKWAVGLPRKRV